MSFKCTTDISEPIEMKARIGIIGGTGVYDPEMFELRETVRPFTPYGPPSDDIQIGTIQGVDVAFLPRHGRGHVHPPHKVNYRANIWALKELGVDRIISPCAVGSLQEEFEPGQIVIVDQFVDMTKNRAYTFYDGPKTVHISLADPFCPELASIFAKEAKRAKVPVHNGGTYVCIEGPRFSTRAESQMYRAFADIIGMTLVTHQTGPAGRLVKKVLVEQGLNIVKELYLSILPDRATAKNVIMASEAGGMDIEAVAEETPEKIIKVR